MCGIVGYISDSANTTNTGLKIFRQMLMTDSLRGEDSTGVFYGNRKGQVGYIKDTVPGWDFVANSRNLKKINANANAFVVGHNRYATSGAHWDIAGAHPFHHGNIVMVHNGTLSNHRSLPDGNKFIVDSEAICHNINKIGAKDTIEQLEGAFTLVWYDKSTKELCMIRNEERPLHLFITYHGIFFCSEKAMGEWIITRNNTAIQYSEALPVGELRRIDITTTRLETTVEKMKVYEKPVYQGYQGYQGGSSFSNRRSMGKNQTPHTGNGKNTSVIHLGSQAKKDEKEVEGQRVDGENTYEGDDDTPKFRSCCICSDWLPYVFMSPVLNNPNEHVCKTCDELYFQANGQPIQGVGDWLYVSIDRAS